MTRTAIHICVALNVVLIVELAGCGGSTMSNSARQLQSVMVTPQAADAQTFPGAKVQFTAAGHFNMAPMTVSPMAVLWSVGSSSMSMPMPMPMSDKQSMPAGASIDANGVAQCNGFTGIVTIQATAPANPGMPLSQMGAMTMNVAGQAQMTCP